MDKLVRKLALEEKSLVSTGVNHYYDVCNSSTNLLPHCPMSGKHDVTTFENWKTF